MERSEEIDRQTRRIRIKHFICRRGGNETDRQKLILISREKYGRYIIKGDCLKGDLSEYRNRNRKLEKNIILI